MPHKCHKRASLTFKYFLWHLLPQFAIVRKDFMAKTELLISIPIRLANKELNTYFLMIFRETTMRRINFAIGGTVNASAQLCQC